MVKKTFTLIETIFVIVILGLISVGSFKAIEMLYQRYYQVNTITKFTILSQTLLDEVSTILYYRTPLTAIGYSPTDGDFKKLSGYISKEISFLLSTNCFKNSPIFNRCVSSGIVLMDVEILF